MFIYLLEALLYKRSCQVDTSVLLICVTCSTGSTEQYNMWVVFFQATKLRQDVYGEQHPLTLKSLDKFTMVYAEVGKQQYTGKAYAIKTVCGWEVDSQSCCAWRNK